jgi:hypothetical protein
MAPYQEGTMSIPLSARVVRQDQIEGSYLEGIAIPLDRESN